MSSGTTMRSRRRCGGWSRAGLLPERAGQPVKALVHVSLADLMLLEGSSALMDEWAASTRARWAAHRAAASTGGGSDGGAWLDGDTARAFTCDASMTPVVTGEVNPAALDELVRLCVQLDKLSHDARRRAPATAPTWLRPDPGAIRGRGRRSSKPSSARPSTCCPARAAWPGSCAAGSSAPASPGPASPWTSECPRDIPAAIRRAVILRDQHCRFPGGCDQPAAACEVHHLTHKADGGKTSVHDCALFCTFHHQVVIHLWGWTVVLNPDGITTAWNKDKTKVLHSHGPPSGRGNIRWPGGAGFTPAFA